MSNWQPTEGMKRANKLLVNIELDRLNASLEFAPEDQDDASLDCPMMQARLLDAIAKAIDQALADGAEQDALASVVGNGHALPAYAHGQVMQGSPPTADRVGFIDEHADGSITIYPNTSGLADPVGFMPSEVDAAFKLATFVAKGKAAQAAVDQIIEGVQVSGPEAPEPKKARGRPKGTKNKKAKAAKKAAKVKDTDTAKPVETAAEGSAPEVAGEAAA